jgi:hypothetical protein
MGGYMKRFHFPKTRFVELATRQGGIARDMAIGGALKNIESARAESDETMLKSIAAIEEIAYAPGALKGINPEDMRAVLRLADQIVTLAGMFCYDNLDMATRSLCDLVDGMLNAGVNDAAPVIVHAKALRLMAPGSPSIPDDEIQKVLSGLERVLSHYHFEPLSKAANMQNGDEANFEIG